MSTILDVLVNAAPQLKNVGSFNPAKLDPTWKAWMMRAERVFIDTFGGDFKRFFGAIAVEYKKAQADNRDPEEEIKIWIMKQIAILKIEEKQDKLKLVKRH